MTKDKLLALASSTRRNSRPTARQTPPIAETDDMGFEKILFYLFSAVWCSPRSWW